MLENEMIKYESELSYFDLRYESFRIRNIHQERKLFHSIYTNGIKEPLLVTAKNETLIVLDGFKRYRCARKLRLSLIPYYIVYNDTAQSMMYLLRLSNSYKLSMLEEAKLIDELATVFNLSMAEIAHQVDKSKGWVGMRHTLLQEISEPIQKVLLSGKFPLYSYMYTIRSFMRMNDIPKNDIEKFVLSLSGEDISTRDIELLAKSYFTTGNEMLRHEILEGKFQWVLNNLKTATVPSGCNEQEKNMVNTLNKIVRHMQYVVTTKKTYLFQNNGFSVQINVLAEHVLSQLDKFSTIVKEFYDTSRKN